MHNDYENDDIQDENMQKEAIEKQQTDDTNKKIVKTGAKAAANYFAPGVGAKVVDVASKTKLGDSILDKGGKVVSKVTDNVPMGNRLQGVLNKANETGVLDAADSAVSALGSQTPDSENNLLNQKSIGKDFMNENILGNKQPEDSSILDNFNEPTSKIEINGFMDFKPSSMTKIVIAGILISSFFVFMILIIALNSLNILKLTDSGNITVSKEIINIKDNITYVGDKRASALKESSGNDKIDIITSEEFNVEKFKEVISPKIDKVNSSKYVVINFDIDHIDQIDDYINEINNLVYNKVFILSINPVLEDLLEEGSITNSQIESVNKKLEDQFKEMYIDTYYELKENIKTEDGINYLDETNKTIHELVIDYVTEKAANLDFEDRHGKSLIRKIGEDEAAKINEAIKTEVETTGYCLSDTIANVGKILIDSLLEFDEGVPYQDLGRYVPDSLEHAISENWGYNADTDYESSYGLDSDGFVHWALNISGVDFGINDSIKDLVTERIESVDNIYKGSILLKEDKTYLVISIDGDDIKYADVINSSKIGYQTNKKDYISSNFEIIDTKNYYNVFCLHVSND